VEGSHLLKIGPSQSILSQSQDAKWDVGSFADRQKKTTQSSPLKYVVISVLLVVTYFVTAKLGLRAAFLHPSATPVWPPTGITLAAFLIFGYRVWPAILLGAFLSNWTTAGTVSTSLGIAIGNTSEGLVGSYLVNRYAGGLGVFNQAHSTLRFVIYAAMLSTTVSATCGVTSLSVAGFAEWNDYGPVWLTWWLGDAVGAVVVAPTLVLLAVGPYPRWDLRKFLEAIVLGGCLFLVGLIVFGELAHPEIKNYPLEFLCIPFLLWAGFRFGTLEVAIALPMLAGIAIWGTLHGYGPFPRGTPNESLLLLQAFMGVSGATALSVAAVVSERKNAEEALRRVRDELEEQAATDPLTGLANYRRLVDVIDAEIERSQRTRRSFALILFDLDGLKKINDTQGHLVGSAALCRLANILGLHARAIDTAARYGGDEFALLLPETDGEGARYVAGRIAERMMHDGEPPPISASFGIGVFPMDGETLNGVFRTADAALYMMKRSRIGLIAH
jgi:diguanylate cyclase (GGDEF)-like protein